MKLLKMYSSKRSAQGGGLLDREKQEDKMEKVMKIKMDIKLKLY